MGSRINISLQSVLGTTAIEVKLKTEELNDGEDNPNGLNTTMQSAEVTFFTKRNGPSMYYFDCDCHAGIIQLSADFNFFRDPERHSELMRLLYENSVSFTVHH